jgi:hypothetical protein
VYLLISALVPNGQFDAYAFWNTRARFIFYSLDAFHYPGVVHADYPILMPLIIALGYRFAGSTTPLIPIVFHLIVFLSVLWCFRRQLWLVWLVGMVAIQYATYQFADLPLALTLLLATIAYFNHYELLVGVLLGLGLHLKNEGMLIALCFFAVWMLRERRIPWRAIAGILPFAALLILFKLWVGTPNDVVGTAGTLQRILDSSRYWIVLLFMALDLCRFGTGAFFIFFILLWLRDEHPRLSVPLLGVLLIYAGYYAIYITTPHELVGHMGSSHDRLVLQLFPTFVYALTTAIKITPQNS